MRARFQRAEPFEQLAGLLPGGASIVCLVAAVGWFGFRLWSRDLIQAIVTEVWRRADEGRRLVIAIDESIADSGRCPSYPIQDDQRFTSYLKQPPAAYWYFQTDHDPVDLDTHFAFIEWSLHFRFFRAHLEAQRRAG